MAKTKVSPRRTNGPIPVTHGEVLREAADLFCERGYEKTRMQDIAARFGVTHAALYYHFKSKQDILEEINTEAVSTNLATSKAIAAKDLPVADRFRELLHNHILWVAENASLAAVVYDFDSDLSPKTLKRVRQMRREFTAIFSELYEEGIREGVFADTNTRLAVAILLGAGNWIYRWYDADRHDISPTDLADASVALLEAGYIR
ncbi:MAG: TetR/AcrR family transcriptional regulator [Acidimicrobiales bacterium]